MGQTFRKVLRAIFNHDPSFCDMHDDAHLQQTAQEYLAYIQPALTRQFGDRPLNILDAGCQAGRLLIPLARQGHLLTGIDTSRFALRRARSHAKQFGVEAALHRGDISQLPRWMAPGTLDAVICAEVLYLCPNFRQILQQFKAALKPGGLSFISHRPASYYLGRALLHGHPERLEDLAARREGASPDGDYHNWQTPDELRQLYREAGFELLACHPIESSSTDVSLPANASAAVHAIMDPEHEPAGAYAIPIYYLAIARRV